MEKREKQPHNPLPKATRNTNQKQNKTQKTTKEVWLRSQPQPHKTNKEWI
jgi:hypothetical protein